jgi:hypothetical protein
LENKINLKKIFYTFLTVSVMYSSINFINNKNKINEMIKTKKVSEYIVLNIFNKAKDTDVVFLQNLYSKLYSNKEVFNILKPPKDKSIKRYDFLIKNSNFIDLDSCINVFKRSSSFFEDHLKISKKVGYDKYYDFLLKNPSKIFIKYNTEKEFVTAKEINKKTAYKNKKIIRRK